MDTRHITQRPAAAVLVLLAALAAGCGGGSAASASAPHSTAATRAAKRACQGQRPILYLEGTACADGTTVPSPETKGAGNSWSPSGGEDAFVSANANRLIVRGADGVEHTLYRAPGRVDLVHRVAWSPDGSRVAVLLLDEHGFNSGPILNLQQVPSYRTSLAVFDAQSGRLRRRVALPVAVVHMPYLMNPPDTLAFSPDGRRVLVSWESPAVVDIARGRAQRIWPTPAVATWTADGSVLFLDVVNRNRFGALRSWSPADGSRVVWTRAQLAANGIVAEHGIEYGQLRTSPDGSRLAVRTVSGDQTAIAVFALAGSMPGEQLGTYATDGAIWDFDWAPDGSRIAAIVVAGSSMDVRVLDPDKATWTSIATIPITIEATDTLEALAPIRKLSWNG
jgi:hypothetical protein